MCNQKTTTEAWGRCYHNYKVVITVCQGIRGQNFKTHLYMLSQMCQFSKKKLLYTVGSEQCWPYRNNTTLINGIIHPEEDSKHQFLLRMSILQPTLLSATKAGYGCCITVFCKIVFTSCTFARTDTWFDTKSNQVFFFISWKSWNYTQKQGKFQLLFFMWFLIWR